MGDMGPPGPAGSMGPAGAAGSTGPAGVTSIASYGGVAQNVSYTGGTSTVHVGPGTQLTITHPGQTVFGMLESSVFPTPNAVPLFRTAIACFVPASQGPLDKAADAASAGGAAVPTAGASAYQTLATTGPSTLAMPVMISNLAPGTYYFGLCEVPGLSGSYNLVDTTGWLALAN
jgi:hypothetical protein